ncbi:MAG: hypothetical protein ABSG20_09865 [Bradyrhizobium sp.]
MSGVSEFLEVRCGLHRFLVLSADIDSIEVLKGVPEPFGGKRVPRQSLLLDGRVLAGNETGRDWEYGVALRAAKRTPLQTRVAVDQVGALIHCDPGAIEPLPRAVMHLRVCFSGVWREPASQQYLFCVRPRHELALESMFWRRRIRRAAMTNSSAIGDKEAST